MSSSASTPTAASIQPRPTTFPFRPDLELLLRCSQVGAKENALDRQLARVTQWPQVLELAEYHGVTPLLYQAARRFRNAVPAEALDALQQRYEHNARRNLKFVSELILILDCLDAQAIPALPYKGPALAQTVYGDVTLREFSDLDILVCPADVRRAKEALRDLHYSPHAPLTPAEEKAHLKSGYEFVFDSPAGRNLLEIQFAIVPRFYAVDFDLDAFFARASPARIGGRTVKTLSPEDLLLALCVHAAKHAWIRLCWLRDIAGVVQSQPLRWDVVEQRAAGLGIDRMLGTSLLLANRWLGAAVHESLLERWSGNHEMIGLCSLVGRLISSSEEFHPEALRYFRLMLRLRERMYDKLRFASRLLFTPGVGEWSVVRLPEPLFPLYRGIRFFRLLRKLVSTRSSE